MDSNKPQGLDSGLLKKFTRVTGALAVLSFGVMSLGALVRATDAGLACPDWPLCYGKAVPLFDWQIFFEWFHRLVAGGLGILTCYLLYTVIRYKALRQRFAAPLSAAVLVLTVQIVLGGLTVLHLLDPKVVSLHLINAVVFLTILLWLWVSARRLADPQLRIVASRRFRSLFVLFNAAVFVQLVIGGMVSTNYAGLACPDFPTCHGYWFPPPYFLFWVQQIHRFAAYTVFILSCVVALLALRESKISTRVRSLILCFPGLVVVQMLLGIINVWYQLPDWASVLHLANALFIYAGGVTLVFLQFPASQRLRPHLAGQSLEVWQEANA